MVTGAERSIYAYDPRIPPEREVRARIKALVEERRGTDGELRFAEQYICTCRCGGLVITSDAAEADQFRGRHAKCRAVTDPAALAAADDLTRLGEEIGD